MRKVEHIGIAVKSLTRSVQLFEKILDCQAYKMETIASEKVSVAFFRQGETKVELLESLEAGSPLSKFIAKNGEGIHHIAFGVENLEAEMERLQAAGFVLLNGTPKPGGDGKMVCFLHPKETAGVLIELCADKPGE
jgi:methylmalonyl-CoA/ethylmalonyl-CoA epimerase